MKVLTVRQPFASFILAGMKVREYRNWQTAYRGPLAIHAAQQWAPRGWINQAKVDHHGGPFPTGVLLGAVDLVAVVPYGTSTSKIVGWRYAWVITNPRSLPEPIPMIGKRMLWDVPDDLVRL